MKNVLEWLEETCRIRPEKICYRDVRQAFSFEEIMNQAKAIGTFLADHVTSLQPAAVFGKRAASTPGIFLGIVYSGRAYAPLDASQPRARLEKILERLQPSVIVADEELISDVEGLYSGCPVYKASAIAKTAVKNEKLLQIRRQMTSRDPLYIIFTSGSTGIPKGVVTCHDSLIQYINAYTDVMGVEENDILGNQSPLDYIAAIRDIYLPLRTGCASVIIPKEYFMEPNALFSYLNENRVTCVGWSVSAFTVASTLGAFEEAGLETVRKICFSGSVMPAKCLQQWQRNLPQARFVNQYGPTEVTASCTYYVVDHPVRDDEILPIGTAYENYRVFILKEDNTAALPGEEGEICVCGPCLALGYYGDPEKTSASFVRNPLNPFYPELMYRTGDIGLQREDGILEFHGRRDRQIKHMGHRVELDEIESAARQIDGVGECCCLYQHEKEKLHLFYSGSADKKTVILKLRETLPGFMVPRAVKNLETLPRLANGKTDMRTLSELIGRGR